MAHTALLALSGVHQRAKPRRARSVSWAAVRVRWSALARARPYASVGNPQFMNYSAGEQLVMGESIRQTDTEASSLDVGAARTLLSASGA